MYEVDVYQKADKTKAQAQAQAQGLRAEAAFNDTSDWWKSGAAMAPPISDPDITRGSKSDLWPSSLQYAIVWS